MKEPPSPSPDPASARQRGTARSASLALTLDGVVTAASATAASWWQVSPPSTLVGRPFAGLFYFEGSAGGGDRLGEAWKVLSGAATARPVTLQARVGGEGFEIVVHLVAVDNLPVPDERRGGVRSGYIARLERTETLPGPRPAAPVSVSAVSVAPAADMEDEGDPFDVSTREHGAQTLDDDDMETSSDGLSRGEGLEADEGSLDDEDFPAGDPLGRGGTESGGDGRNDAPTGPDDWSALEGGNVGMFAIDFVRGGARYSEGWRRLLGYDADDVGDDAHTLGALFHPDDSQAAPSPDTRGRRGVRVPFSAEARLRTKDGSWRWMQFEGLQAFGNDGRLARLTGIMLDVQERHDLEEDMGRVEDRFRRLLADGRHGFFELDLTEDTGTFSPEFRHALGYTAHELPSTPDGFLRLLPAEDAEPGVDTFFGALADTGAGLTRRLRLCHKDGRKLEFDVVLGLERTRRREIVRVVGVLAPSVAPDAKASGQESASQSVTPSSVPASSAPDALVDAARSALDAVAEAVVLTDETGCVAHANARAAQWIGGDPQKFYGRPVQELFVLVDRANDVPAPDVVRRVLQGGSPLELDHRYALISAAGDRSELVITCRALYDVRKHVTGGIVILRKPSEMPLSPAELVASNRMETLGRLACGIAHDFNNILTTVTGSVSLALDKREWEPLAPATKALATARNLARQLLTFARGDTAEKKVQAINDLIKETARLTAAGSKSAVILELSSEVYPVNVDTVRLVQVFTNLILNAMQVMPAGGRIFVRTQNMRLGQVNSVALAAGEYVRIEVQDDGPGIPADNIEHVFEPFFSTRTGGTGLGLAMVRSILTQHEGAIEVASTVGTGTTFTLYLPRAVTAPVKESSPPMSVTYGSGRILVMDDDADLCMVAKGMLEVLGYTAETATSAAETINFVRRSREIGRRYDAVILDLTMAGGPGGEEVLPQLHAIDPELTAIVSSGYVTDDQMERYQKMGFAGVLAKPYRSSDLGRAIKDVLDSAK